MEIVGVMRKPSSITTGIVDNAPLVRRVGEVTSVRGHWLVTRDEDQQRIMVLRESVVATFDNWADALAWKATG